MRPGRILVIFILICGAYLFIFREKTPHEMSFEEEIQKNPESKAAFTESLKRLTPKIAPENVSHSDSSAGEDPTIVRVPRKKGTIDFYEASDRLELMTSNAELQISDYLLALMNSEDLITDEKLSLFNQGTEKMTQEERTQFYEMVFSVADDRAILRKSLERLKAESSAQDFQGFLQRLNVQRISDEKAELLQDFE